MLNYKTAKIRQNKKTNCPIKNIASIIQLKDQYPFKCTERQLPPSAYIKNLFMKMLSHSRIFRYN